MLGQVLIKHGNPAVCLLLAMWWQVTVGYEPYAGALWGDVV